MTERQLDQLEAELHRESEVWTDAVAVFLYAACVLVDDLAGA